jgi:serine phosphatase RsbU (regulator of sigma subunit)
LVARIPSNMFVTCFYGVFDPNSGSLSYANAGHDLPYVRRRDGDPEELRARGMPLGLIPGMGYEEKETALDAGEATLFYSDGLVEAHDPYGEMFGFPRLRDLVAKHGGELAGGDTPRGALLLHWRGLGAGRRHHPPYAATLSSPKLNYREDLLQALG